MILEAPNLVQAVIKDFTRDELRDRGVVDLKNLLALAAGVEIAPACESGPASFVPAFWY